MAKKPNVFHAVQMATACDVLVVKFFYDKQNEIFLQFIPLIIKLAQGHIA